VKTFNGIPQPPQQSTLTQTQLNNQKYKDYYAKPKKVSFEKVKSYNDVVKGSSGGKPPSVTVRNIHPICSAPSPTELMLWNLDCSPAALDSIGNRLLDWFSVIMADTKGKKNKGKAGRKGQFKGKLK